MWCGAYKIDKLKYYWLLLNLTLYQIFYKKGGSVVHDMF